jgi:toxin ParE1/3/4
MNYKLKITETARRNYEEIALYIYEQSKSVDVAVRYVRKLQADVSRLKEFPKIGSFLKDELLLAAGYRYLVLDDYLTFYKIDEAEQTVYIYAVFNSKADYSRILK